MIEFPEGTLYTILEHYGWHLNTPKPGWHTVKCGAHKDSQASCRVNDEIGAAKCQACDFGGDIIKIVQFYEGEKTFNETLSIIEQLVGIQVERVSRSPRLRGSVSGGPRSNKGDRGYVPPRLRGKS